MVLGIGIDAVSIERMASGAIKDYAVHRLFHPAEVAKADTLKGHARAQFLASRYAAKEAFGKALGCGMCGLVPAEIEVVADALGRPSIHLEGRTAQYVQELAPGCRILLSLTHEPPLALAQVVLTVGESMPAVSIVDTASTDISAPADGVHPSAGIVGSAASVDDSAQADEASPCGSCAVFAGNVTGEET